MQFDLTDDQRAIERAIDKICARYGDDYDGVISTVPLAYMQGLYIHPIIRAINQAKPGAWIPPSKRPLLNAAVKKTCDGLDGLEDGVIGNADACTYVPNDLKCVDDVAGASDDSCLTAGQIEAIRAVGPLRALAAVGY